MASKDIKTSCRDKMTFSCHCGDIRVAVPLNPKPELINECMCSNCRIRGCALVYYAVDRVTITKDGKTTAYLWGKKQHEYTFCSRCGVLIYWYPIDGLPGERFMGINSRCVDRPDDLKYVERRTMWDTAQEVLEGVYDENGPLRAVNH